MTLNLAWLLVFQKLLIHWDFHEKGKPERENVQCVVVEWTTVDEKHLIESEVRGEWAD